LRSTRLSLLIISLLLGSSASAGAAAGTAAEPFFPHAGDPGIDVYNYKVALGFKPGSGRIRVAERVSAYATRQLGQFSLDLFGLHVHSVNVNGSPASFGRGPGKLRIRLPKPIQAGHAFAATIRYDGNPTAVTDPDGTKEGWIRTEDGAIALGEPQGTAAWLACDNVPGDKAAFQIQVTVPRPLIAVANGHLAEIETEGNRRRYEWRETRPMSTYLALVDIGRGRLVGSNIGGLPSWTLVDPRLAEASKRVLSHLPEVVRFESRLFGGYPFDAVGSVVDYAPEVGYALETQTRPFYPYVPDLTTVVHETAHQWFGDSVGLKRWPEIWLNEGFATWTEWYYAERHGRRSVHAIFNRLYKVPASNEPFWDPPSAHPGTPAHLFGPSVYIRGAMALEALRLKIGTEPMLLTLRRWAQSHRYDSGTIKEFTALAENISGRNLDPFFGRWLYRRGKP
jgi:aminopeptidase N